MSGLIFDNVCENSKIKEDTILYRITSPTFARRDFLLNGAGSLHGEGRFNVIHQLSSYASNNILLCITEKLFHMNWNAFQRLKKNEYQEFVGESAKSCVLVAFKTEEMLDLINIDSSEAKNKYSLNPSTVTHPGCVYKRLQQTSNTVRQNKTGILYPSARHSKGQAVCFFWDKTNEIKNIESIIQIELSLVSEDMTTLVSDPAFDPTIMRVSHCIGYYKFDDDDFDSCHEDLICPEGLPAEGYINFHRIQYNQNPPDYPNCAMC